MATKKKNKSAAKKPARKTAAEKATSKKATSKKATSKKATSKKATSKKATSKKATSKKATSKKATSKKATSKKATSKKATSKTSKTAAKKAAPAGTRTIVQHVFLPAPPATVYRMLTDPMEHGAFTGTVCEGEPIETGSFTASSGYIRGRYEALETDHLIVCSWQTSEWPKGAPPSRLELVLEAAEGGTELTMTHSELPPDQAEDYRQGWIDSYWTPMREALKG